MLAVARRVSAAEAAAGAGLLALAVVVAGPRPLAVGLAWLALVTPRLVAIDAAEHRLPDAIVLPGYPVVLAVVVVDALVTGGAALPVILAGAAYGALLLVLHLAGGMGFGDVKLAPLLGALAAAAAPGGAVIAVVLAFLIGGLAAVVLLVTQGRDARLPFGPPMLLGTWSAMVLLS